MERVSYYISPSGVYIFQLSPMYLRVTLAALPASNLMVLTEVLDSGMCITICLPTLPGIRAQIDTNSLPH